MLRRSFKTIFSFMVASTLFLSSSTLFADVDHDAKQKALSIIEKKRLEIATVEGKIDALKPVIKQTQDALKNAEKSRFHSYFYAGIPAALLLALTGYLGTVAATTTTSGGDIASGIGCFFKAGAAVGAVISGLATIGVGSIIYIKWEDANRLSASLDLFSTELEKAKADLQKEKSDLSDLEKAITQ